MVQEKNIIKKLNVEVNTSSLADAFYFKDHLDTFFRDEIYPEINSIFENLQIETGNNFVRFDSIPLEINISSKDSIKDIKPFIISKLNNILTKKEKQKSNIKKTTYKALENDVNVLVFYLEKGRYPWFSSEKKLDSKAIKRILNTPLFQSKLQRIIPSKNVQKRLIYQFDDKLLTELVFSILKVKEQPKTTALNLTIIKDFRLEFWSIILDQITNKNTTQYLQKTKTLVKRVLGKSLSSNKPIIIPKKTCELRILPLINLCNLLSPLTIVFQKSIDHTISLQLSKKLSQKQANVNNHIFFKDFKAKETIFKLKPEESVIKSKSEYVETKQVNEPSDNGILVNNAGLVLLHPFLKQFFKNLKFLSENNEILNEKIPEAIYVLHYLATKQENPNEHDLLCEKFICNIPFEEAILPIKSITKEHKTACNDLLSSVLTHWPALKTKDVDVLRSEFLTREGKITITAEKEKLFVQRKTVDILLDRLPWNLGIMSLPWKKNMVFLEW
ncbi:contractile injection system tape measure protein [Flavivirga jejuensis]|uniref:Contractile injection system tape measure protein n=1 Tax=Flavivirga jejuensis TaxID=870487 RepID=A0ABT8WPW7_9FLAO|nr:contractile injection system tape measure protein [Flavivirga jejuensis]MDO5975208.1 contractile injection system tape measure protein [Flavivirga jejuensis]